MIEYYVDDEDEKHKRARHKEKKIWMKEEKKN
jgi:hypothetical protein